jgi:hypothetical protein
MSNEKQEQTAVEFAVEKLEKFIPSGNQFVISIILEQAKEMFEEQIKDAIIISEKEHIIGGNVYPPQFVVDKAERYYKKTYGGNK